MKTAIHKKKDETAQLPVDWELFRLSFKATNRWRLHYMGQPVRDFDSKLEALAYPTRPRPVPAAPEDDSDVVAVLRSHREEAGRRAG